MNDSPEGTVTEQLDAAADRAESVSKWWVVIDGKPEGPHSAAYIALLIEERRIKPTTLVCEVGQFEWQPVAASNELMAVAKDQVPGSFPPALPAAPSFARSIGGFVGRFTNPALPRFANWICVYCVLVSPAFFALGWIFTLSGFNSTSDLKYDSPLVGYAVMYDAIGFVVDVALLTMLVIGGLLLRNLNVIGLTLLKAGIVFNLAWFAVSLLAWVLWDAIVTVGDARRPVSDDVSVGEVVLFFFLLPLLLACLAAVVFEVVSLIWLIRNGHRLPLNSHEKAQPAEGGAP